MLTFTPYNHPKLTLRNRIVLAPMCLNSSNGSGQVQPFHLVHYASRALGGTGLVLLEATAVTPGGRITDRDLGIWDDHQLDGLSRLVDAIHDGGAKAGIQLAHAGRKSTVTGQRPVAPSPLPYREGELPPQALSRSALNAVVDAFATAAARAAQAGFDVLELHAAHGYLIHQFLSPLTNKRTDAYNGDLPQRMRFLLDIIEAVRDVWPQDRPLLIRLSATDGTQGGLSCQDTIHIVERIRDRVDLFDITDGGLVPIPPVEKPGYLVGYAEKIKTACSVPVITVGLLTRLEQVEAILENQQADLVALGRELLRNPYWPLQNSPAGSADQALIPPPYRQAFTS